MREVKLFGNFEGRNSFPMGMHFRQNAGIVIRSPSGFSFSCQHGKASSPLHPLPPFLSLPPPPQPLPPHHHSHRGHQLHYRSATLFSVSRRRYRHHHCRPQVSQYLKSYPFIIQFPDTLMLAKRIPNPPEQEAGSS